jgi:catechol 2,3-dioxygenase-like lactoylglutathione lyase family enzyme
MTGGQVHHIVIDVADLSRSEDFYGAALGLPSAGRNLWTGDGPTASFLLDREQYLVLEEVPSPRPDPPGVHIRFAVPPGDWDGIVERLTERGYHLHDDRKGGLRAVGEAGLNVTDPDGHVLELEMHGPAAFVIPSAGRGKVVAGKIEDFPIGSVTRVPEGQFFLVRLPDGFLAISQVCTHMQFAVAYQPEHFRFYCARHRRKFSRTGAYIPRFGIEDTPPLHVYAIEYFDGQVVVDTDTSIPRSREEVDCVATLPC